MYYLLHEDKLKGIYDTDKEAYLALKDFQPYTWDMAVKWHGWKVVFKNKE